MFRPSVRPSHRRGLTLIELVVVIAILVVLGGLLVQNLPNMMKRTHLAKCSDTISSLNNVWNQSFASNVRYPDIYDSLISSSGSAIDTRLTPGLKAQVSAGTLTAADVAALKTIGVTRVVDLQATTLTQSVTYDAAPQGATARLLGDGASVAELNFTAHETAGNILQLKRHLVRQADGSMFDDRANVRYVVFGIGPNCTAVGSGKKIQEAPVHFAGDDTINPTTVYQRYLAVFSLAKDATGAVTANFEAMAGNDTTGPSSGEAHIRQFHETAQRE
jgi:prepilin-type N-terminal cleavage/methylation domain-containing protein